LSALFSFKRPVIFSFLTKFISCQVNKCFVLIIPLPAEIQKLKHGVPKGDKKKKKELNEKVEMMEAEFNARHEAELEQLKRTTADATHSTDSAVETDVNISCL